MKRYLQFKLWYFFAVMAVVGISIASYYRIRQNQAINALEESVRDPDGIPLISSFLKHPHYVYLVDHVEQVRDCRAEHRACLGLLALLESSEFDTKARAAYSLCHLRVPALRERLLAALQRVVAQCEANEGSNLFNDCDDARFWAGEAIRGIEDPEYPPPFTFWLDD